MWSGKLFPPQKNLASKYYWTGGWGGTVKQVRESGGQNFLDDKYHCNMPNVWKLYGWGSFMLPPHQMLTKHIMFSTSHISHMTSHIQDLTSVKYNLVLIDNTNLIWTQNTLSCASQIPNYTLCITHHATPITSHKK